MPMRGIQRGAMGRRQPQRPQQRLNQPAGGTAPRAPAPQAQQMQRPAGAPVAQQTQMPQRTPAVAAAARPGMSQAMGAAPGGLRAGGLGLGLGLDPRQRGRFLEASQTPGGGQAFLAEHPGIQQRVENRIAGGSPQDTALQNMLATGQAPTGAQVQGATPARQQAQLGRLGLGGPAGATPGGGDAAQQEAQRQAALARGTV